MKKLIALLLAAIMCCTMFVACGQTEENDNKEPDDTQQTEPVEDDGILKILLIGHSQGMDSAYMFPDVARNEGMEKLVVGVLYHSGCRLFQHVDFLTNNLREYAYLEYDISTDTSWQIADCNGNFTAHVPNQAHDTYIEDGSIAQTMEFGIARHDWDIVVMQAGVFESANKADTSNPVNISQDIKKIQEYVLEKDIEPGSAPEFAWNMVWACPNDDTMLNDSYKNNLYDNFDSSTNMFEHQAATLKDIVLPTYEFDYVVPAGTAIQNADTSVLNARDLYRDTIHASDYGRMMVAYMWYCELTGTDISTCKFAPVSHQIRFDNLYRMQLKEDLTLTEEQKNILIESVQNAFANPYTLTQSQYQ